MTTKPAPVDVELLQRLSDAATAGPWLARVGAGGWYIQGDYIVVHSGMLEADAVLACAARNALPQLLAEHRAMAARLAMLEAAQKCNECDNNPCMCEPSDQVFADKEPSDG